MYVAEKSRETKWLQQSVEADGRDVREFGWCQRNEPKVSKNV